MQLKGIITFGRPNEGIGIPLYAKLDVVEGHLKRLAGRMCLETHGLRAPLTEPDPAELEECLAVLRDEGLL